jgi:hypothetical protein
MLMQLSQLENRQIDIQHRIHQLAMKLVAPLTIPATDFQLEIIQSILNWFGLLLISETSLSVYMPLHLLRLPIFMVTPTRLSTRISILVSQTKTKDLISQFQLMLQLNGRHSTKEQQLALITHLILLMMYLQQQLELLKQPQLHLQQ